ncbi:MAG: hypothetical protein HPY50_16835 [Firmicutes bacterium]|nr:hypothetical protein [Bacillota bacterium]
MRYSGKYPMIEECDCEGYPGNCDICPFNQIDINYVDEDDLFPDDFDDPRMIKWFIQCVEDLRDFNERLKKKIS